MSPRTALLVIDMQVFFESMTQTPLANISKLCIHFSAKSLPIIVTQHGHSSAELKTHPSPNQLVRKWGKSSSIATGSPDWELLPPLRAFLSTLFAVGRENEPPIPTILLGDSYPEATSPDFPKLVPKNTYDAFINTPLQEILTAAEVERVVVCGVMTDCCCDTTARSAFNRGFETWLVRDACGSANERQHEAGLRGFEFAFGEVLDTEQVLGHLAEKA